jgi:hypothetical protein
MKDGGMAELVSINHTSLIDLDYQPFATLQRTGLLQFMDNNAEDNADG